MHRGIRVIIPMGPKKRAMTTNNIHDKREFRLLLLSIQSCAVVHSGQRHHVNVMTSSEEAKRTAGDDLNATSNIDVYHTKKTNKQRVLLRNTYPGRQLHITSKVAGQHDVPSAVLFLLHTT